MNSTNPNKLLFVLVSFFAVSISTAMADSVEASSTHSIASSMPSSPPAVHIVYTETPPDENPKDFHIRTLASALGSEEAAKDALVYSYKTAVGGFSAKLTPDQVSRVSPILDEPYNSPHPSHVPLPLSASPSFASS